MAAVVAIPHGQREETTRVRVRVAGYRVRWVTAKKDLRAITTDAGGESVTARKSSGRQQLLE